MRNEAFNIVTRRDTLATVILVANAFVWYFYASIILKDVIASIPGIVDDQFANLLIWSVHFGSAIFSALAGTLFMNGKRSQTLFLFSWMLIGVISSFVPIIGGNMGITGALIISPLFGVSFGVGMPGCMRYYSNNTSVEKRGRLGGITMFITGVGMFLLGIIAIKNITTMSFVLAGWRLSGLFVFLLIKPNGQDKVERNIPYKSILTQRSFILYFVPWILFSLVNYLSLPVLSGSNAIASSLIDFSTNTRNVLAGCVAIVGGFLTDSLGRKRMATTGFVMLGVGYTILGIAPESATSLYFYTFADGIAWGILFVIFVMTVWGDLSYGASTDKYYAIASIPFFVSMFLPTIIDPYVEAISPYAIFSFTAFFLFIAVLPLMYAPETLPEKKIRERELKTYVQKAQKIREKYA